MTISRRLFLLNTAAAGAAVAVSVPAVAVAAAEPERPWDKARRLAIELSDALAECDGGACYAQVFPAGIGQVTFLFGNLSDLPSMMPPLERAKHHLGQTRLAMEEHTGGEWWNHIDLDAGVMATSMLVT
ncbi:hypothetical protein [Pseudaminobacter soli (ex Li et al. 2025)]|uniref:Twin-arginine translocation signal domain-containing protein n=1 Tax=Pseudaminobacter soli (ex Li et al. 2025) TaxID=1295366 RepID=A0A2P7RTW8_9HYPH|nr:hypothetical protein [Mesorhizobium soli]PSJ53663.1 hypothetical protein C7I85_27970 [Mesorhizobium soli]